MNVDKVYQVEHFVRMGETIHATGFQQNVGGKGLNQSVAASRAGATVFHAGAVGTDGAILTETLADAGIDISSILTLPGQSGHAIIQVDPKGHNCIIVFGGTNRELTEGYVDEVLRAHGEAGDIVLLQNETNLIPYIIRNAQAAGLKVAFNPSPIPSDLDGLPLECVDYFIVNEVEGAAIAGMEEPSDYNAVLQILSEKYPSSVIVLTLGSAGVLCRGGGKTYQHDIYPVRAVDTTAAGDTFCGYFLAGICGGRDIAKCLEEASAASAIAVSRPGAAPSIPMAEEVRAFIRKFLR